MKRFLFFACIITLALLETGCKENPVTPPDTISTLSVLEASCTEVALSISLKGAPALSRVTLKRNDSTIALITVTRPDTVIYDTGLQPAMNYTYTMLWNGNSRQAQAHTKETTSDAFTFSTYRIPGTAGPNHLWDVAAISDTDIWAVGEIFTPSKDPADIYDYYNAVHWNGKTWELKQIKMASGLDTFKVAIELRAVYAFASNDVWVFSNYYGSYAHWDGVTWTTKYLKGSGGVKFWGRSPKDLYLVGDLGTIFHFDSASWKKEESNTTSDLQDVWGSPDGKTMWACGYNWDGSKSVLLEKTESENKWRTVYQYQYGGSFPPPSNDSLRGHMISLWADKNSQYYIASTNGIYRVRKNAHGEAEFLWKGEHPIGLFTSIRGWAENDVLTTGQFGTLAHFNGVSWHLYEELFDISGTVKYNAIALLKDKFIAVGVDYYDFFSSAIILTGTR